MESQELCWMVVISASCCVPVSFSTKGQIEYWCKSDNGKTKHPECLGAIVATLVLAETKAYETIMAPYWSVKLFLGGGGL